MTPLRAHEYSYRSTTQVLPAADDHENDCSAYYVRLFDDQGERVLKSVVLEFQKGPIRESGKKAVLTNEVLLAIVLDRLRRFQQGPYRCDYNERALYYVTEALSELHQRTRERIERGVEGTSKL